ncbi:MAG: hypothetical protein WC071_13040, partial [Victivallaceae bacterium]
MLNNEFLRQFFTKKLNVHTHLLFLNETSGNYEIVARSGHIICIIPPVSFLSSKEHLKLARTI